MTIVDAQVHIWPPETGERPYIKEDASTPHRLMPLMYEDLLVEMGMRGSIVRSWFRRHGKAIATTTRSQQRNNIQIASP
jgi:hypothetical protein